MVASVIVESELETKKGDASIKGIKVSPVDSNLLDAAVRLIKLLETSSNQKILAPLLIKEIIYWFLIGGQGARRLTHLVSSEGDTYRISKAIRHLAKKFRRTARNRTYGAFSPGMSVRVFITNSKELQR